MQEVETYWNRHERLPAINIRVYGNADNVPLPLDLGGYSEIGGPLIPVTSEPGFTMEWVEENVSEDEMQMWWEVACQDGFGMAQDDLSNVWGPRHGLKAYQEGRSGGWLTVDGLGDPEEWDAEAHEKWQTFVTYVGQYVEDIPRAFLVLVYMNIWQPQREAAQSAIRKALAL